MKTALSEDGTGIEHKYSAHEDKVYVTDTRPITTPLPRKCRVRNQGGTKTKDDARVVASIPGEMLYAAEQGMTYGGRYKSCQRTADPTKVARQIYGRARDQDFPVQRQIQDVTCLTLTLRKKHCGHC